MALKTGFGSARTNFKDSDRNLVIHLTHRPAKRITNIIASYAHGATWVSANTFEAGRLIVVAGKFNSHLKAEISPRADVIPEEVSSAGSIVFDAYLTDMTTAFSFTGAGLEFPENQDVSVILTSPINTNVVFPADAGMNGYLTVIGDVQMSKNPFGTLV